MALAGSAGCLLGPRASSQDVASYFMLAPRLSRTPRYSRYRSTFSVDVGMRRPCDCMHGSRRRSHDENSNTRLLSVM